jgi:hypothetical protein
MRAVAAPALWLLPSSKNCRCESPDELNEIFVAMGCKDNKRCREFLAYYGWKQRRILHTCLVAAKTQQTLCFFRSQESAEAATLPAQARPSDLIV